jgi:hypothetical protein
MPVLARLLLLLSGLLAGAAPRAAEISGQTPGGAAYRIAVPDGWQPGDGLVLVQHGFNFAPVTEPDLGPLQAQILADGYALAASGYRQSGWALFHALDDNAELLAEFRNRYGEPGPLLSAGGSMGGLIALKLAEDPRFRDDVQGVLAFCPAADGYAAWEQSFDLRLAYDAICAEADDGRLPRGAEPTPWALDLHLIPAAGDFDEPALLAPVAAPIAACTGLGVPPALRNSGMLERLALLAAAAGTQDEAALVQLLGYAVFGLADLVRAPDKLAGRVAFDNRGATYGATGVDPDARLAAVRARMAVVAADPLARLRFEDDNRLDGSASARILSLHTSRDAVVVPRHQLAVWRRYVDVGGPALVALAEEATPTHCGFEPAEIASAWTVLREWLARPPAQRPTVESLRAACSAAGETSCRWRATSEGELGGLGPSWVRHAEPPSRPVSGLWFDPAFVGQGLMLEELDRPFGVRPAGQLRVAASWYTYAPDGGPRWLIGVGRMRDAGVVIDPLFAAVQGEFPTGPQAAAAPVAPWGRLDFTVTRDGTAMHYAGPPAWGTGARAAQQLTRSGYAVPHDIDFSPPPAPRFMRLGTYYAPALAGQGWVLNQFERDGKVASTLLWYTYDSAGQPLWLVGLDERDDDGLQFRLHRAAPDGRFDAAPTVQPEWGDAMLEVDACNVTAIAWQPSVPGYAAGRVPVARLTRPYEYALGNCPRR